MKHNAIEYYQEAQTLDLPVFHSWMSQNHFLKNTSFSLSSLNTKTSILNKAFKYIDKSISGSCSLFPLDPLALCLHWYKKNSKRLMGLEQRERGASNRRWDQRGIFSGGKGESYILPLNFVSHGRVWAAGDVIWQVITRSLQLLCCSMQNRWQGARMEVGSYWNNSGERWQLPGLQGLGGGSAETWSRLWICSEGREPIRCLVGWIWSGNKSMRSIIILRFFWSE